MNADPLKNLEPENARLAKKLKAAVGQIELDPFFESQLGDQLKERHASKTRSRAISLHRSLSVLGWITLAIAFVALTTFMFRSLLPGKTTQPVTFTSLPVIPLPAPTETSVPTDQPPPTLESQSYDWRGTKLTLAQPLPEAPAEANLYQLKPGQHATLDEARALANRFGLDGEVYQSANLYPDTSDYFFTDGKRSLVVSSDLYFTYTADMAKAYNNFTQTTHPNADKIIGDFLSSHGFDFPYKVETDELFGGYAVEPLSPDSYPMRYEYYTSRPMLVVLDENGQVLRLEANLMDYGSTGDKKYGLLSAEEALQKILDPNQITGMIESFTSASRPTNEWRRVYPENQSLTIYGYVSSIPALDPGNPPFVQINANTATGNIQGLDGLRPNTYVEATGQFITENGIEKFGIDSWKISKLTEDGFTGTIHRDGNNVVLATDSGSFTLPDVPNDMPLPFESAYVVGVKVGATVEWTLIDDRMVGGSGGGGGGGGGLGFYQLNLSGTPVPFPTPTPQPGAGESQYIVKAGDTLSAIAQAYGITVDELMQANNITDPGTIYVDQPLTIPGAQSTSASHQFEKQRGMLAVTIFKQKDGSQRVQYGFTTSDPAYPYVTLEGNDLNELQNYNNRPVDIWGMTDGVNNNGFPTVNVSRFEIPYPDLKIQIMKGTEKRASVQGKAILLFTSEQGKDFIQLAPNCYDTISPQEIVGTGKDGEGVLLEALAIPGQTFGGYPTICVFSAGMADSPKGEQPVELTVRADQPYVMDEPTEPAPSGNSTPPSATIEKVELIYFVTNQHWQVGHLDNGPQYIQPVWKFSGHYSNGDVFEILVQALRQEYLLPELAPYVQPG